MTTRLALGVLLALSAAGCRQADRGAGEEAPPPAESAADPSRTAAAEAARGREACRLYVEQVCACAEKDAELAGECDMARARPQALEMSQRAAAAAGNATEKDRRSIQANADQIARACIEDASALVKRGCPAPRPGSRPAPPAPARATPDPTR